MAAEQRARQIVPDPHRLRRFERVTCDKVVRVFEIGPTGEVGNAWEARVVDISRGGVGLIARRMVHTGRGLFVEMENPGASRLFFGVVKQAEYLEGEGYRIGVQFADAPGSKPVMGWLRSRSSDSAPWRPATGPASVYPPPPPTGLPPGADRVAAG